MGTEYRWGGKSGRGIDCSGLVSSAYMQCGVLIYRDAKIIEGWPMHEVAFENKKPGDALFFPGHVALYLGEGRYIHSTGAAASGGVVINSLEPDDPLYREDLVKCLYAVGSVFCFNLTGIARRWRGAVFSFGQMAMRSARARGREGCFESPLPTSGLHSPRNELRATRP